MQCTSSKRYEHTVLYKSAILLFSSNQKFKYLGQLYKREQHFMDMTELTQKLCVISINLVCYPFCLCNSKCSIECDTNSNREIIDNTEITELKFMYLRQIFFNTQLDINVSYSLSSKVLVWSTLL